MPESIILGIPFNFQTRRYFTPAKPNDALFGIQRIDSFLFEELLPLIKAQYRADDYLSLTGHSPTGFLVNYLTYQRSNLVHQTVSLSVFLTTNGLPKPSFLTYLLIKIHFPNPFTITSQQGLPMRNPPIG